MKLKLKSRALPAVNVRRELPADFADEAKCFIEIKARAAGSINTAWMAAVEQIGLNAKIMDREKRAMLDGEGNALIADQERAAVENLKTVSDQMLAALYDHCVIEWSTNVIDTDTSAPLEPTRENFLALCDTGIPEVQIAATELKNKCIDAGKVIEEEDEKTVKN